jgi:hypothetical protein
MAIVLQRSKVGYRMKQTTELREERLSLKELRGLCESTGPCITILLGAYQPGAGGPSHAARLKSAIPVVEQELAKQSTPSEFIELLEPLRELASSGEMDAGGGGVVIFRSPGKFDRFHFSGKANDRIVVGTHFLVTPLLPLLTGERECYILDVSRKDLHLFHYSGGRCDKVPLPNSVPKDVREAGAFDTPDRDLESRSAAGKSTGSMRAVQFGTGSEREIDDERLFHFFRLVDKGLHDVLNGLPLLLAGVEYEVAVYRRAAKYSHILEGRLEGDLSLRSLAEIGQLAFERAKTDGWREGEEALTQFREMANRERTLSGIRRVLEAAKQGRVAKLILAEGAEFKSNSPTHQVLINSVAVLTIVNGGQIYVLPERLMAKQAPVAAVLRY